MALYLQMDGVDDYLETTSLTFNKVVIDAVFYPTLNSRAQYYLDARTGKTSYFYRNGAVGVNKDIFSGWSIFKNDIQQSNNTTFIFSDERATIRIESATITDDLNFLSRYTDEEFTKADLYDIKIYNGITLVAHYDMTTGTVNDQSGNGRHATLTGGTWLDDGTGGTPTGTDGSSVFSLSQKFYSDETLPYSTSQKFYLDETGSYVSNQFIYQDGYENFDSKQSIYEDTFTPLATQQEIFNDGQIGSVAYSLLLKMYSDESTQSYTRQLYYDDGLSQLSTSQLVYENNQVYNLTKQIIYSDSFAQYDSTQKIYSDISSEYATKQSIYDANSFTFNTLQQLFEHSSMDLQTKQSMYHLDTVELLTLQSIFEENSMTIDTLQQFLSDYVEYRQVFKYLLAINRKSDFGLGIVGNQKFGIDISDRVITYGLNVSDQVKKYDLNI